MDRLTQIRTARSNGILNPVKAWRAAKNAGIPYWVMCAFLMQESAGGQNIYGHDVDASGNPRPFWGHGEVTQANYEAYKKERDLGIVNASRFPKLGRRSQGVGPMQLTWWEFQDKADAQGGCWDIYTNMLTGAQVIAGHYAVAKGKFSLETQRWHYVALKYNGKESYAVAMDARFAKWKSLLA